jgi:Tfp pilus assembly protein PilO
MPDFFSSIGYRSKIAFSAIFSITIIGGILYFLVWPAADNIKMIKSEAEGRRLELEKNYLKGKDLKVITGDLKTAEPQLEELRKIFVKKEKALDFINELEKIAQNNKLEQKIDLSPNEKDINGVCKEIPIQLLTGGNFSDQIKYLSDLEVLDYYISIQTIEMSLNGAQNTKNNEAEKNNRVNMQILANTYWQP